MANITISGTNPDGSSWVQVEQGAELEAPYLLQWGYHYCQQQDEAAGNTLKTQLYEWIYRCLAESFSVTTRTIRVTSANGQVADYVCTVDNGEFQAGDFGSVTELTFDAHRLVMPLLQFYALTQNDVLTVLQLVAADNPALLVVTSYNTKYETYTGDPYDFGVNGGILTLTSIYPTVAAMETLQADCAETVALIKTQVLQACDLTSGETANDAITRMHVCKVIHDALSLETELGDGFDAYLRVTMYAPFSKIMQGNCRAYTMAFCYLAQMYGIEVAQQYNGVHRWALVNPNEAPGAYTQNDANWTTIDCVWDLQFTQRSAELSLLQTYWDASQVPTAFTDRRSWWCFGRTRRDYLMMFATRDIETYEVTGTSTAHEPRPDRPFPTYNPSLSYLYGGTTAYIWPPLQDEAQVFICSEYIATLGTPEVSATTAKTGWSDIITSAMVLIDDIRWKDDLATDAAAFYAAKADFVKLALPMLSRPPELASYLQKGISEPSSDFTVWTSTEQSVSASTEISTGKFGYSLCSVALRSDDGLGLTAYSEAEYNPYTGIVTFPAQSTAGLEYEIDFYTDGAFSTLTPQMMRLFSLAVAVVWDERFDRNWLNDQMKIKDASFEIVNESNYLEKTNERMLRNRLMLSDELRKYEQDCAYAAKFRGLSQTTLI